VPRPGGAPGVGAERGKVGKGGDPRGMESAIRESAAKWGVDPDTAVAVAKSEGLSTFQSTVRRSGKGSHGGREDSWGAFQLYMGGGLGNKFQKETGLDPRDPANEKATIDFAMKEASKSGWGAWHGARKAGIGNWAGIGKAGAAAQPNGQSIPVAGGSGGHYVKDGIVYGPKGTVGTEDSPLGKAAMAGQAAASPAAAGSMRGKFPNLITHHTGGRGTPQSVAAALRGRGLTGYNYFVDRDGNVVPNPNVPEGKAGQHIRPGWGREGRGIANRNAMGLGVIARSDADMTQAQRDAAAKWARDQGYTTGVTKGHGQVNPGHRHHSEGQAVISRMREMEAQDRIDSAVDTNRAPPSSVAVTVNSNGTKADATAQKKGPAFQEPAVVQKRQLQPTDAQELGY
jgi:hypothetical protein